jgi:hypothetical protein
MKESQFTNNLEDAEPLVGIVQRPTIQTLLWEKTTD